METIAEILVSEPSRKLPPEILQEQGTNLNFLKGYLLRSKFVAVYLRVWGQKSSLLRIAPAI